MDKQASEMLIGELTRYISTMTPINAEKVQAELSALSTKYHIQKVESNEVHPDILEKIDVFLAAKSLEGASPHTMSNYARQLRIFAESVKKKAENVSAADIRIYLSQFSTQKPASIETKLSILKSFFGWLHEEEIIDRNPTRKLKSPKKERSLPKALRIEDLEMLRESTKTKRQRAFLEVLYATGCRLSEVQALNITDIDLQSMSAKVVGKGNKQRTVYLSFRAMYHLEAYLKTRKDENPALFVTERKPHDRLSTRGIQREIGKIAKQSGIKKNVSPHTLRHTFATLTLNNGAELAAVQDLLGHSSPETTLIYARLSDDKKNEQHRKFLVQ